VERPFEAQGEVWEAVVTVPRAGRGPWDVEVVSGADGAYLLLLDLTVDDDGGTWRALIPPGPPSR
jgi:hypothetical protein